MTRIILILRAYLDLAAHDLFMLSHDFSSLHRRVRSFPLRKSPPNSTTADEIAFAVDVACCYYPKQALCLERSSVLVKMLRRNGIPAHMVIGAQKLPFKAHAWVEVNGNVLNDRLASRETFLVLEIC